MLAPAHRYLFVGTHGHVAAIAKADGETVWSTSLPNTGYGVVTIIFEDGLLFCAAGGHCFALDPESGAIRWQNALKGLGTGLVYLTTANSNNTEAILTLLEAQREKDAAAGAAGASAAVH